MFSLLVLLTDKAVSAILFTILEVSNRKWNAANLLNLLLFIEIKLALTF